jgi:molybdopterin-binding protein
VNGTSGGLQVAGLAADIGEFRLRDIDLDVRGGEYFVILGPTGAGKTVLLEAIAGHFPLRQGAIVVGGRQVADLPPERRSIGFVYQDYALFPHLTASGNIAFGLKLRGASAAEAKSRVRQMASLLGIEDLLERLPGTLSGGEQQRVALARALAIEPRLLLLDEPLSALDPETREGVRRELARLHGQLGTTTIHVTHDFEEAVALADRVAVMDEGRLVQVGAPHEVFRKPDSEFVARFVGVRNVFRGEVRQSREGEKAIEVDGTSIRGVTDLLGPAHVSIRPEDIVLSTKPIESSARNSLRGRIVGLVDTGPFFYVTVSVPPDFVCLVTRASVEELGLEEGRRVYLSIKATAVHVF